MIHHTSKTRLFSRKETIRLVSSETDKNAWIPPMDKNGQPYCGCRNSCNSCDDVHQAYVRRGWASADPNLIDQYISASNTRASRKLRKLA
ncbi:hypothetical protein COEREDRAFT_93679 [Coemansia reversa NRRL 1564]|uniref:Endoplasmic reticulum vesicle transporter C-terminal domain-containing protein n=1 Tax=Coemansia reversa (strain ATCC 12441 / NRRL 1564) TaxID=763665 RepID=A0A2G5B826_COERN|nr:hypothetical protein COEREDRAFT_93679 [Coemansia reversa NRRL 1564]|eukprot:PIA14877.1 hypothetical protein COEREDRAFT_93679 [Coemansia reversa NRRL 1564]